MIELHVALWGPMPNLPVEMATATMATATGGTPCLTAMATAAAMAMCEEMALWQQAGFYRFLP